jgi:hypothetical protein
MNEPKFAHPDTKRFYGRWLAARGRAMIPPIAAVQPESFGALASNVFRLQAYGPRHMQIEVFGPGLEALTGRAAERNTFDTYTPETVENYERLFANILRPSPCLILSTIRTKSGRDWAIENAYLPAADDNGKPRYVIGFITLVGERQEGQGWRDDYLKREISSEAYVDVGAGVPERKAF